MRRRSSDASLEQGTMARVWEVLENQGGGELLVDVTIQYPYALWQL